MVNPAGAPAAAAVDGNVLALGYPDDDLAGTATGTVVVNETIVAPEPAAMVSAFSVILSLAWLARRRTDVAGWGN